jgi:hypothetical protein
MVVNPRAFMIVCFQRLDEEYAPGVPKQIPCTSGKITISISSAKAEVSSVDFDLANADHMPAFDTTAYPLGAYRIQSSGTANGNPVTSPDSYFSVNDKTLTPFPKELSTLQSAMFLLVKNADGTPSGDPVPAPVNGPAGHFIGPNANGAAVWQIDNATTLSIPQKEYDWLGRRLAVPLPFSPVYLGTTN